MKQQLTQQLEQDEGTSATVYQDQFGFWTLGTGRLVDKRKPGAGLRQVEIDFMLQNDIDDRINAVGKALPWFQNLDDARQGVLLNMAFQLGTDGLLAFHTTLGHVQAGNYAQADADMLQSPWASQTPGRAKRLSTQMETGIWQYANPTTEVDS